MDGGICSNPAHVDLVAGSKRALIITLTDGVTGAILTTIPHPIAQNIEDIKGRFRPGPPRNIKTTFGWFFIC
jgi:NTE family protein